MINCSSKEKHICKFYILKVVFRKKRELMGYLQTNLDNLDNWDSQFH